LTSSTQKTTMPKDAKKRSRKDSDTSDSGPDDPTPVKKSSKSGGGGASKSSSGKPCAIPGDEKSGEPSWSLGNMKFVKVREFKGKTYIDIREYYTDQKTMETRPGKKGISLNCQQYQELKQILNEVDNELP